MKKVLAFSFLLVIGFKGFAQQSDSLVIRKFFNEALTNSVAYKNLDVLVNTIGARLSGSKEAALSVDWTKKTMQEAGADTVWLQEVWVPHWVRGEKETGMIISGNSRKEVPIC